MLLHQTPGVGAAKLQRLLEGFGSAQGALASGRAELAQLVGPTLAAALGDRTARQRRYLTSMKTLRRLGAEALAVGAPSYPTRLLDLAPPPPVVYLRGRIAAGSALAIVGTRRATGAACARAAELAAGLVRAGYAVVSGGAYGVDAAAHLGALDSGGMTTVVFGGGLDRPYPERHIALFERAARQGAVLTPFRPGTPPLRGGFLARNRIIAALSEAVIVVEAGWRSGARSTALAARALGRVVFAMPGSPGTGRLLAEGALEVGSAEEALGALSGCSRSAVARPAVLRCAPEREAILEALAAAPQSPAETIARRAGVHPAQALAELMALVLEGRVVQQPGGRYCRVDIPDVPPPDQE